MKTQILKFSFALCTAILFAACEGDDETTGQDAGPAADATPPPLAKECSVTADCDDGLECTTDVCVCKDAACQARECQRIPDNGMCDEGETCVTGTNYAEGGCTPPPPECPESCDDGIACTVDACGSDFQCHHQPQSSLCGAGETCNPMSGCQAPPTCPTSCDDGYACTVDFCQADDLTCQHTPVDSACPSGQECTATGGASGCTPIPTVSTPTIACRIVGSNIEYTISGGIVDHLYPDGGTVATPTYVQYGSNTDGWCPYPAGSTKPQIAWAGSDATYVFTLNAGITDLNFFVTDTSDVDGSDGAVGGKYFLLSEWTVTNVTNDSAQTPNCHVVGGGIVH
jgi:hypothetical protein